MQRTISKLIIAAAVAASAAGCSKKPAPQPAPKPLPVATIKAKISDEPRWVEVLGVAVGGNEVVVQSEVSGRIIKASYSEGDPVKKGDPLFLIDPESFKAAYNEAAAKVETAQVVLKNAEQNFARDEKLFKSNAASAKQLEDSKSAYLEAKSSLAAARSAAESARINLERTVVRAPADGFASDSFVKPGALVSAHTTNLAAITQHDDVKVEFTPSDTDLSGRRITKENRVEILYAGSVLPARLDYIAQSFDETTGTRLLRAELLEESPFIPGELLKVRLMTELRKGVFRVPQKAILQLPDGSYSVYVMTEDGKAREQAVLVDKWTGADWIVTSGLKPGDRIIIDQLLKLRDGASVAEI